MGWHSPYQYGRMPRNTPCVMCHALCCEHRLKEGLTHMQARTHARCACQTCRPVQYTHAHTLTHTRTRASARTHTHADTHAYRHVGRYVDMHPVLPLHQHAIAHNTCCKGEQTVPPQVHTYPRGVWTKSSTKWRTGRLCGIRPSVRIRTTRGCVEKYPI